MQISAAVPNTEAATSIGDPIESDSDLNFENCDAIPTPAFGLLLTQSEMHLQSSTQMSNLIFLIIPTLTTTSTFRIQPSPQNNPIPLLGLFPILGFPMLES